MLTEAVISLVILGTGAYFIKNGLDNKKVIEPSPYYDDTDTTDANIESTSFPDPNQIIYESNLVNTKEKYRGDLILVNEDHEYFGGDEDLVSITEMNTETNRDFFSAVDSTYTILRPVYEPMAKMVEDFYNIYHRDTIIVYGSYRTNDLQQKLYEEDLADTGESTSTRVAKPGYSEHQTGLAFDFTESENHEYDGTGDYAWINANCYRYGFIVRYTEAKEKITKFRNEPWHFRYVGIPHAFYMDNHDLCLEEYIDLIKEYPYDGREHLEFTDDKNNEYEVYFVPSDDGAEKTTVPVPVGLKYEISGNNVDGFIVTVYKDQKKNAVETASKSAETTTTAAAVTTAASENDTDSE